MYILSLSEIAERIKQKAKEKGLTIKQLQLEIGVGANYINQMGNGRDPSISVIVRLASVLDCSICYLLGIDDERYCVPRFTQEEEDMIDNFRRLNRDDQLKEFGRIQALAERATEPHSQEVEAM